VAEPIIHAVHLPEWSLSVVVVVLAAGFPATAVISWFFDIGPAGVERTPPRAWDPPTLAGPTLAPPRQGRARAQGPRPVTVRVVQGKADPAEARFGETFLVGRSRDCDVLVQEPFVSRRHLRVAFDGERWSLRDQDTMSGTFVDGRPVREMAIDGAVEVEVGQGGPRLSIVVDAPGNREG
jgi:hypothetical protein